MSEMDNRIDDLENRVEAIESLLSDQALGKERHHHERKKDDAREVVSVGDTYTKVVDEIETQSHGKQEQAVFHVETGVVTFVKPGGLDLDYGDMIEFKITDVGESWAEGVAIEKVNS